MLLIEDDEGDALLVSEELAEVPGAPTVQWVRSLAEAVDPLHAGPECVLLDLGLPDASGLSCLRSVRELAPDAAVLVLTGHDDEHLGARALGEGAQDYLVKGAVDGPLLARAIRYSIERRSADRAALALREAHLQARENMRLERSLLPIPLISRSATVRIVTGYRPSRGGAILGGDFLDAVELADGSLATVIGDVSGHDADEAALGACLRIAWRTLVLAGSDPEMILRMLEQVLVYERHDPDIFATLCMVNVSPDRQDLRMHLLGHPPPVLVDRRGTHLVQGTTRPPLGIGAEQRWPSSAIAIDGPWSLLLYTDGLIEGHVGAGPERLGSERLVEVIAGLLPGRSDAAMRSPDGSVGDRDGRATASGPARDRIGPEPRGSFVDAVIADVKAIAGGELSDDVAALWIQSQG